MLLGCDCSGCLLLVAAVTVNFGNRPVSREKEKGEGGTRESRRKPYLYTSTRT